MKSIVVVSYYHIMHALAIALTFDEKPLLYVSVDFTMMPDEILERMKKTGIFEDVIKINTKDFIDDFLNELRGTVGYDENQIKQVGNSIFEKHIETYYAPKFRKSDFDEEIYIYTDYHLSMYFINKHFKKIIMGEDGYGLLKKRIDSFKYIGYFNWLKPFIEYGYYPELNMKSDRIKKIICSGDYEELEEPYKSKVIVWDYKIIVKQNEAKYKKAIKYIFTVKEIGFRENSILLLEQPLYKTGNCSSIDYYLFYRKILRQQLEKAEYVYFKPHPAGRKHLSTFEDRRIKILPAKVPVEIFNYADVNFKKIITFYSNALDLMENVEEKIALYDEDTFSNDKIKAFIQNYVRGEKINIGIFIKCAEVNKKNFLNYKAYFTKNPKFTFNVCFIIKEDDREKFWNEFLSKEFSKYNRTSNINVIEVKDMNEHTIVKAVLNYSSTINDYLIVVEDTSNGNAVINMVKRMCGGKLGKVICSNGYSFSNRRGRYIYTLVNENILTGFVNILWHRDLIRTLNENDIYSVGKIIEYVYENNIDVGYIYGEGMPLKERTTEEKYSLIEEVSIREIRLSLIAYFIAEKEIKINATDITKKYNWEEIYQYFTNEDVLYIQTIVVDILTKTITMENIEYSNIKNALLKLQKRINKIYAKKIIKLYFKLKNFKKRIFK